MKTGRWLGLRRAAWVELAVFIAAALAVDFFLFRGDRFWGVSPHPFWIAVLLLSVQYGTGEGLLAAAVSSVALLVWNLPEPVLGADRYAAILDLARRPILWFVAAVVLGELRRRQSVREERLRSETEQSRRREEELRGMCVNLLADKDALEERMAGQPAVVLELCRSARHLAQLDPDKALLGAMDVARAALRARKFSLFLRQGHALEVVHTEGWSPGDAWSRHLPKTSPLAHAVLEEGRLLCVATPGEDALLSGEGIAASPLRDPATRMVLGMMKVEAWQFDEIHNTRLRTLEALADWIAAVYAQARLHQALLTGLAGEPREAAQSASRAAPRDGDRDARDPAR